MNEKLEKYKIMQEFTLNEGHVLWNFSQSYLIANTIILAFVSQKLSDNFLNKPHLLVFLLSFVGLTVTLLWLSSYWRRSKYYEFRIAQLREVEEESFQDWNFVAGKGKGFSNGESVQIKEKEYSLGPFGKQRTRYIATTFIFIFVGVYFFLLYTTFPLDIKVKPTAKPVKLIELKK